MRFLTGDAGNELRRSDVAYVSPVHAAQVLEPAPAAMWAVYLLLAAIVVAIGWASMAQVDIVAKANGRVVPDGREQIIASLEGGILRELSVREGQQVEAGQALALLDPTRFEAQQAEGQAKRLGLKATLARFARSFALSSKSGVPIVQGLSVVAQTVDNAYVCSRIEQMRDGVERGESILRTAATTGVFTPVVLQMIAVGEESGALDDLMDEIAEMYEREVDYELKTLSAQIEPILIIGLAILVLILALGVFLPIWDLGKAALHK